MSVDGISRLFHGSKQKWANPEASVGKLCGMKGHYRCWEAKGPAEESYKNMSSDITTLLKDTCNRVPKSSKIIFDVFMIGKTESAAVPQIMFSCRLKEPRKKAMQALRKSEILSRYPGFETGHWDFPPHILNPKLLAYEGPDEVIQMSRTKPLRISDLLEFPPTMSPSVSSPNISAIRLYADDSSEASFTLPKATIGSLTYFSGKLFYVSVSHPFGESSDGDYGSPSEDDDSDSEFEFGGLDEDWQDSDHSDEVLDMDDTGSKTSESSGYQDASNNDSVTGESLGSSSLVNSETSSTTPTGRTEIQRRDTANSAQSVASSPPASVDDNQHAVESATVYLESTDLDYALIEPSGDHKIASAISALPMLSPGNVRDVPSGHTDVLTVTGSKGLSDGVLSGRPSYIRLPHSKTFQEVYTAIIHGPIMPGDSGSVVLDSDSRNVYGHIVAGSTISRIVYIIPASNVLNDLKSREETSMRTEMEGSKSQTKDAEEDSPQKVGELQLPQNAIDLPLASSSSDLSQILGLTHEAFDFEDDVSVCSDADSIFSDIASIASTNTSVGEISLSAISEVVYLFRDSKLQDLYPKAITKLGPDKFQRNFRRLLLRYGRQLLLEASNNSERQAAAFIRHSATHIAARIRESTLQTGNAVKGSSNPAQLNKFLQGTKGTDDEKEVEDLSDSSEPEDWEADENASLDTLEGVKSFMVTGKAFSDLCEAFQAWLKSGQDPKGNTSGQNLKSNTSNQNPEDNGSEQDPDSNESVQHLERIASGKDLESNRSGQDPGGDTSSISNRFEPYFAVRRPSQRDTIIFSPAQRKEDALLEELHDIYRQVRADWINGQNDLKANDDPDDTKILADFVRKTRAEVDVSGWLLDVYQIYKKGDNGKKHDAEGIWKEIDVVWYKMRSKPPGNIQSKLEKFYDLLTKKLDLKDNREEGKIKI